MCLFHNPNSNILLNFSYLSWSFIQISEVSYSCYKDSQNKENSWVKCSLFARKVKLKNKRFIGIVLVLLTPSLIMIPSGHGLHLNQMVIVAVLQLRLQILLTFPSAFKFYTELDQNNCILSTRNGHRRIIIETLF